MAYRTSPKHEKFLFVVKIYIRSRATKFKSRCEDRFKGSVTRGFRFVENEGLSWPLKHCQENSRSYYFQNRKSALFIFTLLKVNTTCCIVAITRTLKNWAERCVGDETETFENLSNLLPFKNRYENRAWFFEVFSFRFLMAAVNAFCRLLRFRFQNFLLPLSLVAPDRSFTTILWLMLIIFSYLVIRIDHLLFALDLQ